MDDTSPPPVERLIQLGEPYSRTWRDYSVIGITTEHVPALMRILRARDYDLLPGDRPEVWAPVHAWRALAQLQAPELVPHLLERLDDFNDDDDWDDVLLSDFASLAAAVGPSALETLTARLRDSAKKGPTSMSVADAIAAIARKHPEVRPRVVDILRGELEKWRQNPPDLNAMLVSSLADLRVPEAMPVIREAMAAGAVDKRITGPAEYIEWELGLRKGPKPPVWSAFGGPVESPGLGTAAARGRRNARQRAQTRRRQAKASKKRNRGR